MRRVNSILMKATRKRLLFPNLAITQRLPLLIFLLLLAILITFSIVSYVGVRKASFAVARERLSTLTDEMSTMFNTQVNILSSTARNTAGHDTIKQFLHANNPGLRTPVIGMFDKIRQDTQIVAMQLFNAKQQPVITSAKAGLRLNVSVSDLLPAAAKNGYTNVGRFVLIDSSIYYPVTAAVNDSASVLGYLVYWRLLHSTPQAIKDLGKLIGSNGTLYFGNDDGKFWTDMLKPVAAPPIDMSHITNVIEYSRKKDDPLIATAYAIPNSHWLILMEFSKKTFDETSYLFLQWMMIIGIGLIVAGSFLAWVMSRSITRPLKKLTAAASGIAAGDYNTLVDIKQNDELGQLAEAFNIMAIQVRNAQQDLEKKVRDRTFELENSNKELEAFSYSVSHDLHAPLRIIDGYAAILSEKSAGRLDEEGNKILRHIRNKTKRMGTLIDELLNLSYLGRKELEVEQVDMVVIVKAVIKEQQLLNQQPVQITVKNLLPAMCDSILIRQVWSNLLSNAIKYSAKVAEPCIEIDSWRKDNTKVYAIKDNGVGFDMKYASKLFGVFQRLHGLKEFEGSGVGLALVQRVIVKHGGTVWAEAEEGKGATFYFSLPG